MPIIQTPRELGLIIRTRRKELGWDQAMLASQMGVTRQWVIEIEKGKPRAEIGLALRALRVLGLSLDVYAKQDAGTSGDHAGSGDPPARTPPHLDINAVVEKNRGGAKGPSTALPQTAADYLKMSEADRRAMRSTRTK